MTLPLVGPIVRATTTSEALIWAEFAYPCEVTVTAHPLHTTKAETIRSSTTTLRVGEHYYSLVLLRGLTASTWYSYELQTTTGASSATTTVNEPQLLQYFRTFTSPTPKDTLPPLRIAYGSCRKLDHPEKDTLAAFGPWLQERFAQRDDVWPHLLLMIGDQIYADQPPPDVIQHSSQLALAASNFDEFALLYQHAWTYDSGIRQVLAALPTYMIFDDHEITNNWNAAPNWQEETLRNGQEQTLVDGLVAYWLYQGWGNILPDTASTHPLLAITQSAQASGRDCLDDLRQCVRSTLTQTTYQPWHYTIATEPSIFVTNTRTERTAHLSASDEHLYDPAAIMSEPQVADLKTWLMNNTAPVTLLVSSVPLLLPPLIGLIEYYAGKRFWHSHRGGLHYLGRFLARLQLAVAEKASFDHWPLYALSWQKLLHMLEQHQQVTFVLSGDVHFSYAATAQAATPHPTLFQLVCTPFQNALSISDRRKIEWQSFLQHTTYGGLHTRLLHLQVSKQSEDIKRNHLYQDALALLTLQPDAESTYRAKQEYLGLVNKHLEVIAHIDLPSVPNAHIHHSEDTSKCNEPARS